MNKKVARLIIELKAFEETIKDFNAEEVVNKFLVSGFYSADLEYDCLKKRCKEWMVEFVSL